MPDSATLEITGNKWNLNQWLQSNGYPNAVTTETTYGWTNDYPVLLKPVSGIEGKGIKVIFLVQKLLKSFKRKKHRS
ncbi:MAG: hypothetical protein KAR19_04905 [Bacteroidales bacterium]|nr:hypothetical protein [Bacteroidales bacterium]